MGASKIQITLLLVSYFIYLILGSLIFQALETDFERELKTSVYEMKAAFLRKLGDLTPEDVEQFVENLTHAVRRGIYPLGNATELDHDNWDFSNSFFFVGSIVSTIGYGTLSPKTAGGQIFCVIFALFGIPLNLIFLHRVGKTLSLLCEKLGKCLQSQGMKQKKTKFLTLLFFLVTGILIFLGLPSVVFHSTEGWTYNEGIYFAFITLSTVGFGDYVVGVQPGKQYCSYYRALVAIWILFGLAWIALLFNLLTRFLEDTEKKIAEDLHKMGKVGRENGRSLKRFQCASPSPNETLPLDTEEGSQKFVFETAEKDNREEKETSFLCEAVL
ncbi:potassium channel, subfamily K, member 16-like [Phascolarctos cinereus]|uniref:Potassium channel subfamily K member 16-like n=1 Tax=Phascolarctos cinereus TaxID=38626 RepID=A0A6P5K9L1_PHACI|nr:potassium channel subfamily K member 16-like [Phascolarctos cinereus]